ncbi:MAG: hypothetical protein HC915_21915, partial [Anaerolineae bacterium]|nr:hypothetical protein [Anaerolineae bacterium]
AGVAFSGGGIVGHVPAINTQLVDTTGAGDALAAAAIFGLLRGDTLKNAARLGVAAAALTLQQPGSVAPQLSACLLDEALER